MLYVILSNFPLYSGCNISPKLITHNHNIWSQAMSWKSSLKAVKDGDFIGTSIERFLETLAAWDCENSKYFEYVTDVFMWPPQGPSIPLFVSLGLSPSNPSQTPGGITWASATNGTAFVACAVHFLATFEWCCCLCRVPWWGSWWLRESGTSNDQKGKIYQGALESTLESRHCTSTYINIERK